MPLFQIVCFIILLQYGLSYYLLFCIPPILYSSYSYLILLVCIFSNIINRSKLFRTCKKINMLVILSFFLLKNQGFQILLGFQTLIFFLFLLYSRNCKKKYSFIINFFITIIILHVLIWIIIFLIVNTLIKGKCTYLFVNWKMHVTIKK